MGCPQCQAEVPAGARFCSSCGHELVVVGDQRRIATVLFADLVGFTALSETLDPEQVKGLVDTCFERLAQDIESFGGRVDKVVGDAIVALFGAPVAHEDDAERAVRAGLRMQETIASITDEAGESVRMRVGINTGEVLVGAVRAGREYTAMGDVVNTASRLQDAATPGTVLVGPDTWAATVGVIEYAEIDAVEAKGKRLPVEARVALRASVPPGQRIRRVTTPLVGRETELSLLTSVSSTAIERTRAALLLLHGEAGMGKSRLASAVACHATDHLGARVLQGRCVPYGEANVWWPVAEAVRDALGVEPATPPAQVDAALRRVAEAALTASGREDEVDRIVAGLHHLLGHDGSLRGIDATRARDEVIRSVVALADGFTRTKPLMVMLSDLHWADQEVLDLLDTLLARLARRPFAVLATARRSLQGTWRPSPEAANSVVLHLDPLDDEASTRLLELLTEGALHPAMAAMLVRRSGGNPFYLEELVSLVSDAGVRTVEELLHSEAGELPTTLRGLVAARLDALGPMERQLLDDAAVLGRRNRVDSLVKMAEVKRGVESEQVRALIEGLAAREFLVIDGDIYSFRSDVIRDVAYSTLTKADRARSHAGIAHWIESHEDMSAEHVVDQTANHWAAAAALVRDIGTVSGVPADVDARAVRSLGQAIALAARGLLWKTVVGLADQALELAASDHPERASILADRARARVELYDLEGALEDVAEATTLARHQDDRAAIADLLLIEADAHQHLGDMARSLRLAAEAEQQFATLGDARRRGDALRQQGQIRLLNGAFDAADGLLQDALSLYRESGDRRGEAWALQNLAWSAYIAGRVEEAEQRLGPAMATFEELGDPGGLTWSRGLLAWVRFHQGREDEAEELAAEVGLDARERGETWGEAMMAVLEASIALWSGRANEAVERGTRAEELFAQIDDGWGIGQAQAVLGRALVMSGELLRGLDLLRRPDGQDAETGWMSRIPLLSAAAQLGDVELASEVVDDWPADGPSRAGAGAGGGIDALASLALHALQKGDVEGAFTFITLADDRSQSEAAYLRSVRALAHAARGSFADAIADAESLDRLRHTYLDRTYAEIARALSHAGLGQHAQARQTLDSIRALVDGTTDRVAQAVVPVVAAMVSERVGGDNASALTDLARRRLDAVHTDAHGWRNLAERTLGVLSD